MEHQCYSLGMQTTHALAHIATSIRTKRRESKLGLRAAAKEIGLSAATLSRLERGLSSSLPDAESLSKLAAWLNTTVSSLLEEKQSKNASHEKQSDVRDIVEVHLRADKKLTPETAKALAGMFRTLYDQVTVGKLKKI